MKFIIAISRIVGMRVDVRGIGFAEAESMQDLVKKLGVGDLMRTDLQPRQVSVYFTEAGEVSTPEELRKRVLKAIS